MNVEPHNILFFTEQLQRMYVSKFYLIVSKVTPSLSQAILDSNKKSVKCKQ